VGLPENFEVNGGRRDIGSVQMMTKLEKRMNMDGRPGPVRDLKRKTRMGRSTVTEGGLRSN